MKNDFLLRPLRLHRLGPTHVLHIVPGDQGVYTLLCK